MIAKEELPISEMIRIVKEANPSLDQVQVIVVCNILYNNGYRRVGPKIEDEPRNLNEELGILGH